MSNKQLQSSISALREENTCLRRQNQVDEKIIETVERVKIFSIRKKKRELQIENEMLQVQIEDLEKKIVILQEQKNLQEVEAQQSQQLSLQQTTRDVPAPRDSTLKANLEMSKEQLWSTLCALHEENKQLHMQKQSNKRKIEYYAILKMLSTNNKKMKLLIKNEMFHLQIKDLKHRIILLQDQKNIQEVQVQQHQQPSTEQITKEEREAKKMACGASPSAGDVGMTEQMQALQNDLHQANTALEDSVICEHRNMCVSSPSSSSTSRIPFSIPSNYICLNKLGEGDFGTVMACYKQDTREHVAVKLASKNENSLQEEINMMKMLMQYNMDEFNIVRFIDSFIVDDTMGLVFEKLDISLFDMWYKYPEMVKLPTIRTVLQQLAVALDALKSIGVIHGDLKHENIMLVDHSSQYLRVKLIDFGLAKLTWDANDLELDQVPTYSAPEVLLGLPLSEAMDIWSLGTLIIEMLLACFLFPGDTYYNVLLHMIDILGPLPDHLLNVSRGAKKYFTQQNGQWLFKTPDEMGQMEIKKKSYTFRSLDELKMELQVPKNETEATENSEFIELMKAMLQWDQMKRITPRGILKHPFITESFLSGNSHAKYCNTPEPSTSQDRPIPNETTTQVEEKVETLPPGVILVETEDLVNGTNENDIPDDSSDVMVPAIMSG